ncbi:hypothetical protein HK102_004220, partial [Quaeritorhiza haematococci]
MRVSLLRTNENLVERVVTLPQVTDNDYILASDELGLLAAANPQYESQPVAPMPWRLRSYKGGRKVVGGGSAPYSGRNSEVGKGPGGAGGLNELQLQLLQQRQQIYQAEEAQQVAKNNFAHLQQRQQQQQLLTVANPQAEPGRESVGGGSGTGTAGSMKPNNSSQTINTDQSPNVAAAMGAAASSSSPPSTEEIKRQRQIEALKLQLQSVHSGQRVHSLGATQVNHLGQPPPPRSASPMRGVPFLQNPPTSRPSGSAGGSGSGSMRDREIPDRSGRVAFAQRVPPSSANSGRGAVPAVGGTASVGAGGAEEGDQDSQPNSLNQSMDQLQDAMDSAAARSLSKGSHSSVGSMGLDEEQLDSLGDGEGEDSAGGSREVDVDVDVEEELAQQGEENEPDDGPNYVDVDGDLDNNSAVATEDIVTGGSTQQQEQQTPQRGDSRGQSNTLTPATAVNTSVSASSGTTAGSQRGSSSRQRQLHAQSRQHPPRSSSTARTTAQDTSAPAGVAAAAEVMPRNPRFRRLSAENLFAKRDIPSVKDSKRQSRIFEMLSANSSANSSMNAGSVKKPVSALTSLINDKGAADNPFAADYRYYSGKGDPDPVTLKIYLPFSDEPLKPLVVFVKREASVEDVIGYSLYEYFNEGRKPAVPNNLRNVIYWSMRIVEDDGTIDEDFPALERSRQIKKFAFDQFALCEATPEQVKALEATRPKVVAQNTNLIAGAPSNAQHSQQSNSSGSGAAAAVSSATSATATASPTTPSAGAMVLLKIHLYSTLEVKQSTTVSVVATLTMAKVFEEICRKKKMDPKDYVFKKADTKTDVPLDKTLEQLGETEFCVLKKHSGGAGDIFLRPPDEVKDATSDAPFVRFVASDEYNSVYKQYVVIYKYLMGRHERLLTIDGDFIHVVAGENKNLFDISKTASHHIATVISCKLNKKNSPHFKLIVRSKAHDTKTYDMEATSTQEA